MNCRHVLLACLLTVFPPLAANSQDAVDRWWLEPQRLLQTNLREIDATMDLDRYIQDIHQLRANVVLFNVGGIVANYPTDLEFHYRNTFMEGDLVGTVLKRLHENDVRMIGRFDFSKINEKFAARHPEWLYVSETGKNVNYNGQVHTCVCGGYQQEYMFKILGEAIDRYPLDGVFFNMIGFQRNDYSGNHHGICQCENCKRLFKEFSDLELPEKQSDSPKYRKYVAFTRMMVDRQFSRVNQFLKDKRPDLAICTYTSSGVDVIRKESNRPLGQGAYHDTDKAKWTLLTCGERQLANAAVHFFAIPFRHAAVSPQLTTRRLWQHLVNGAWLDFYCIGPLQLQEDRLNLEPLNDIFQFHAAHEPWLAKTLPAAQVGLVRQAGEEYEGILEILCEQHIAFGLVTPELEQLKNYDVVLVPNASRISQDYVSRLDQYVADGGKLLMTGRLPEGLRCFEGTRFIETRRYRQGSYIRIRPEDREQLAQPLLDKLDLVYVKGPFHVYQPQAPAQGWLRLIPPDMFGPPEKCYYRKVSDHPALLCQEHGQGAAALLTFNIGELYHQQAHLGHAALLVGAVDQLLQVDRRLRVNTAPLVEINHRTSPSEGFEWISFYNHTGARGNALHEPLDITDIEVSLRSPSKIREIRSLATGEVLRFEQTGESAAQFTLPRLGRYDIVLIQLQE